MHRTARLKSNPLKHIQYQQKLKVPVNEFPLKILFERCFVLKCVWLTQDVSMCNVPLAFVLVFTKINYNGYDTRSWADIQSVNSLLEYAVLLWVLTFTNWN